MGTKINKQESDGCRQVSPKDCPELWDRYVASHPQGSIFHTSAMHHVFDATPGHQSYGAALIGTEGEIVAMLPSVRVETISGFASRFGSRSIMYAEPLCDDNQQGRQALATLLTWHDESLCKRTLLAEVRPLHGTPVVAEVLGRHGYEYYDYMNFLVDVSHHSDLLWRRVSKSTRNHIRRSLARGVKVEVCNTMQAVEQAYELVHASYKRSQVPLASLKLFQMAHQHLPPGTLQVRLAYHENRVVAAGYGLVYRDRFYAWYGGTLRQPKINPFACLTWDEIRWSSEQGLKVYDFGGAGKPNEKYGPHDFKARFGGDEVCFGRYENVYSPLRKGIAETGYQVLRRFLTK